MIQLTLEKGYQSVTIRDITERADIGYATFFRHYRDKDALLSDVLEVVLEELMDLLSRRLSAGDAAAVGVLIFRYVQEHSEVCQVLLSSQGSPALAQRMVEAGVQNVLRQNTPQPQSPVPFEVAAYHLVTSSIGLIRWWLEHGMPYSPEQMGEIYYELIARSTIAVAFTFDTP